MQNWQDRQLAEGEEFIIHPHLSLAHASDYPKISKVKRSRLARAGAKLYTRSQRDSRSKLFRKTDLEAFLAKSPNRTP